MNVNISNNINKNLTLIFTSPFDVKNTKILYQTNLKKGEKYEGSQAQGSQSCGAIQLQISYDGNTKVFPHEKSPRGISYDGNLLWKGVIPLCDKEYINIQYKSDNIVLYHRGKVLVNLLNSSSTSYFLGGTNKILLIVFILFVLACLVFFILKNMK